MPQSPRLNTSSQFRDFSQSGMAYVAILVLTAVLSALSFAFLFKAATRTSASIIRGQSMQAHYLAESAANHALWRLLHEPGFAPASDVYYMHSLVNGRYGYKVRKPSDTTFATVATVGAMENNVVNQSYVQYIIPSNLLTAYAKATSPVIQYRRLIGASWTDPTDTPDIPVPAVYWVDMEGCPLRKEIVMASVDGSNDINLAVWDGASWGNPHVFAQNAHKSYKCFGVAYESQSGNALVVGRTDATTTVRYNIWDGAAWVHVAAQPAFSIDSGEVQLVTMASCPGNSDILIATVNNDNDLTVFHWNGAGFTNLGTIANSTLERDQHGIVEIVYEQQSGDALIIWSSAGEVRYRLWNGSTLGPENIISLFPDDVYVLRVSADPTCDHIIVAAVDKFFDIQVAVWDGTAWTDSREVETSAASNTVQCFDVAWEASGEDAIVAWAPWGETFVSFLTWKKSTDLVESTIEQGPNVQNQPWLVRLYPISQSEKIVLQVENNANDLRYCLWNGDRLKGDPAILLESDIPVTNVVAFDLAEANVPRTGGTGTGGSSGNQAPFVDAGPDQTIGLLSDANLDGTVTDDGLPDPPVTVTATWSKQSGPGTVTFGDASLADTTATFSETGTYILRLTADDSDLNSFDEVTIAVESCPVLMVVADAASPNSQESERKALLENWGWNVSLISEASSQEEFDLAMANHDVIYITSSMSGASIGEKLRNAPIGIVNEHTKQVSHLGFSDSDNLENSDSTTIIDNSHYITSLYNLVILPLFSSQTELITLVAPYSPGLRILSATDSSGSDPMLSHLNIGDDLHGGGIAIARRVQLPWGSQACDITTLTVDGQNLLLRSIEWAANWEGGCGGSAGVSDMDPPTPDPMTWVSTPAPDGPFSISMTATAASDPGGVEYYFECTAGPGNDSGWQDSTEFIDSGLSPTTSYTYRLKTRDKTLNQNETGWSSEASATTLSNDIYVHDITMGFRKQGVNYFGQATVWIKGAGGADIADAVVSGDWSGAVAGTSMGSTAGDGKVMLESPSKMDGGTFTFTVTSVVKAGYVYNPSLNTETAGMITAP